MDVFDRLHRSLDERPTPEAVTTLILEALAGRLLPAQRRLLRRAALAPAAAFHSASDDFERPVPATAKTRTLARLFGSQLPTDMVDRLASDPYLLDGHLAFLAGVLGWMPGANPTTSARLNRAQRQQIGIDYSKRRYNKLVRQMRRTYGRSQRLKRQIMLRQMLKVGRSGFAYSISVEEMRQDPDAAAFVAYWTAQRNRRRAFTLEGRDNPFDVISEALFARCVTRGDATDWWMIARVYPVPQVVARLDDEQRGRLMGQWFFFMRSAADELAELAGQWPEGVDRAQMVVLPGVDSSTWNTVAAGYNAARAGWLNCVSAAGSQRLLNAVCPGKAMRFIAADLAYWHRMTGGDVDRQTVVWAALPEPWLVLAGQLPCTARTVELACHEAGIDPRLSGWTAPSAVGETALWKPTPELVHGVQVADPLWASLLRRAGVFSGKPADADTRAAAAAYRASMREGAGQ